VHCPCFWQNEHANNAGNICTYSSDYTPWHDLAEITKCDTCNDFAAALSSRDDVVDWMSMMVRCCASCKDTVARYAPQLVAE